MQHEATSLLLLFSHIQPLCLCLTWLWLQVTWNCHLVIPRCLLPLATDPGAWLIFLIDRWVGLSVQRVRVLIWIWWFFGWLCHLPSRCFLLPAVSLLPPSPMFLVGWSFLPSFCWCQVIPACHPWAVWSLCPSPLVAPSWLSSCPLIPTWQITLLRPSFRLFPAAGSQPFAPTR